MNNSTVSRDVNDELPSDLIFGRHEFLLEYPAVSIPCLVILVLAAIVGTFGNILILLAIGTTKNLRTLEGIFIANLAISDLYVTLFADPMSIVAKLEGEHFFTMMPRLCKAIAYGCTISCVNSLCTIACLSFNRYIYICHHELYNKIFKKWTCIAMCTCLYGIGTILVLLNLVGIGDHSFDRKSLECIWDRMATFFYTVVFSVTLVWIPIIVIGISYLQIYLAVRKSDQRMSKATSKQKKENRSFGLAKSLFIIYAVFATCWIPYALIIVADRFDTFPHIAHVVITVFAHLHPSINWLVFYATNKKFKYAFNRIAHMNGCLHVCVRKDLEGAQGTLTMETSTMSKTLETKVESPSTAD
ncbi:hypothetical protein FSP39_016114 [Pinctada imbricata]|uniref:G-protein coupled receptors family 1 profile domain-containing protein n=1 Tax=Pinctada imbricata TaxID=66713 RepID=A0AA89C3Q1_PINIB|nr:hypothetical protein FSP39_016114 [Pinctada imbricata]